MHSDVRIFEHEQSKVLAHSAEVATFYNVDHRRALKFFLFFSRFVDFRGDLMEDILHRAAMITK